MTTHSLLVDRAEQIYAEHNWFPQIGGCRSMAEAFIRPADPEGAYEWLRGWFFRMPSCPHTDGLPFTGSDHRGMPSLLAIVGHWQSVPDAVAVLFGTLVGRIVRGRAGGRHPGSGMTCFGCVRPAHGAVWEQVMPGDYERAHLQDSCLGGPNDVNNLIPLCSPCHRRMTCNFSGCRDCAVLWVRWLNHADEL